LSLPFRFSNRNIVCVSRLSLACYMTSPSHPPCLDHSNNICWSVQVMELLIMQSSTASCHFLPLGPFTVLSTLFSNTLKLCSSLSLRDQISHPHKTTDKIVIFFTL
jgi:hypothetical protein